MKGAQLVRLSRGLCLPLWIVVGRQFRDINRKSYNFSLWCTYMATSEHCNTGVRKLDAKRLSGAPKLSDGNQAGQDSSNPDYCSSSENMRRRSSTVEDEQRVKNLLKEILAYRETNVSSWIVEGGFCCFKLIEEP
jgi:hypothetical protein